MKGNLTRRGRHSWRLKYDVSDGNGQRGTRYVTLRGTRREAQAQAVKVLASVASGMHIDPSAETVGEFIARWPMALTSLLERPSSAIGNSLSIRSFPTSGPCRCKSSGGRI